MVLQRRISLGLKEYKLRNYIMTISVLMSVYRSEQPKYLDEALASVDYADIKAAADNIS